MSLLRKLARLSAPAPVAPPKLDAPTGVEHRVTQLPPDHHHGVAPVAAALLADGKIAQRLSLDPYLENFDARRMLLLDTETTGLSGGTGTLAFLVGIGSFEGESLRLEQLVVRSPAEERPMLELIAERFAAASAIVTYNGKTFDWPLLKNRFVMNRLKAPPLPPHLDLLHCARRVFRHREGGAKLTEIERDVLRHHRVDDIPGAEVPERYFRFLRERDFGLLEPVLKHNVDDLVLLAALLGRFAQQLRGELSIDPADHLGYAELALRNGADDEALTHAQHATFASTPQLQSAALRLCGSLHARTGDARTAVEQLTRATQLAHGQDLAEIQLQLAKLHEHKLKSVATALEHAERARPAEDAQAHARRLQRLRSKLPSGDGQLSLG